MAQPLANDRRDLTLGTDGDLIVGTDLSFTTGIDGVAQSCRIALQLFVDEWFLNLDAGIPYFDQILAQKPDVAKKAAVIAFHSALLAVPGVTAVLALDVEFVAVRTLTVTFQVQTALGDTPSDTIAVAVGGGS